MRYKLDKTLRGKVRGYQTLELLDGVSVIIVKSGLPITGTYYGVQHPRISPNSWQRKEFATLAKAKAYVAGMFTEAR